MQVELAVDGVAICGIDPTEPCTAGVRRTVVVKNPLWTDVSNFQRNRNQKNEI